MSETELERKAAERLRAELDPAAGDLRVVQREAIAGEFPDIKRRVSDHTFSVLARGADIVVFFDGQGKLQGWRDEGRKGSSSAVPPPADSEPLRKAVVEELELPPGTRLGKVSAVVLPPAGWTLQVTVFPVASPRAEQVIRLWVDPRSLNVIQCLYGAEAR